MATQEVREYDQFDIRSLLRFLRTTVVGGLLFLVPLVVLGAIVEKALRIAHLVSDPLASRLFPDARQSVLLAKIPGYTLLKGAGESALGVQDHLQYPVVLARIEDAWKFGFLIERLPDQHYAVFVPGSPDPKSGAVYFMSADRVRTSEIPMHLAMKCLRGMGAGSAALLPGLGPIS